MFGFVFVDLCLGIPLSEAWVCSFCFDTCGVVLLVLWFMLVCSLDAAADVGYV